MEITQPSDTAGYANMNNALQTTENKLRKQEAEYARLKKIRDEDWNEFSINGTHLTDFKKAFYSVCPMGTKAREIHCYYEYKGNNEVPLCTVKPWPRPNGSIDPVNYNTILIVHCKE